MTTRSQLYLKCLCFFSYCRVMFVLTSRHHEIQVPFVVVIFTGCVLSLVLAADTHPDRVQGKSHIILQNWTLSSISSYFLSSCLQFPVISASQLTTNALRAFVVSFLLLSSFIVLQVPFSISGCCCCWWCRSCCFPCHCFLCGFQSATVGCGHSSCCSAALLPLPPPRFPCHCSWSFVLLLKIVAVASI